jgi:MFS transporter, AAHS family, 4-hydroxybenzoate transporter
MSVGSDTVNVSDLIDRRGFGGYQVRVFVICFLIALMDGLDSQAIGVTAPLIAGDLHLSPAALGPIFSASQWGFMFGALAFGPCADRWGRKQFLLASALLFAACTFLTALVDSFSSLLIYRTVTGLGLGGAAPCFVAIATEYAPRAIRARLVTILWAALPGGGMLTGFLASYMLPLYGWRSFFYFIGTLSLVVCLLVLLQVPESLSFMVARARPAAQIRRVLARIAPNEVPPSAAHFLLNEVSQPGVPVKHLFTEGRAVGTILLWVAFFIDYFVLIAMLVWMPILLKQTGMSVSQASLALATNNIGGVIGCVIVGYLIDRWGAYALLGWTFVAGTVCLGGLGFVAPQFVSVAIISGFCGLLIGGGGGGLIALAAVIYPTFMRSTGLGWGLGIGRFGGAQGPLLAGALAAAGWGAGGIFLALGLVTLLAAGTIMLMRSSDTRRRASLPAVEAVP